MEIIDNQDWTKDCTTGGKAIVKREMPASSPSIPHSTLNILVKRSNESLIAKGSI
jgi:hypothetical protein